MGNPLIESLFRKLPMMKNLRSCLLELAGIGVLWTAPFRGDITPHVKAGDSEIEIKVTNTWHNRLANDASLPEAPRKTWTYASPAAGAPLELAGLAGPVPLRLGKVIGLSRY